MDLIEIWHFPNPTHKDFLHSLSIEDAALFLEMELFAQFVVVLDKLNQPMEQLTQKPVRDHYLPISFLQCGVLNVKPFLVHQLVQVLVVENLKK